MRRLTFHPVFSPYHWANSFSLKKFVTRGLGTFGLIWLIVESLAFFLPEIEGDIIAARPTPFLVVVVLSLVSALEHIRPRVQFRHRLKDRDLNVEIRIVDAFRTKGALVVPTNVNFVADINGRMLLAKSIQGALIRKHFSGQPSQLQNAIDTVLTHNDDQSEIESEHGGGGRICKKYPIGTVVPIKKDGRLFYLLANTQITEEGRASSTEDELVDSLRSLWSFLLNRGVFGDIVIPLIGSQHGRMKLQREQVVQHILRTFVESCRGGTPCSRLTIAVYPPDVKEYDINLSLLDEVLKFETKLAYYAGDRT